MQFKKIFVYIQNILAEKDIYTSKDQVCQNIYENSYCKEDPTIYKGEILFITSRIKVPNKILKESRNLI